MRVNLRGQVQRGPLLAPWPRMCPWFETIETRLGLGFMRLKPSRVWAWYKNAKMGLGFIEEVPGTRKNPGYPGTW